MRVAVPLVGDRDDCSAGRARGANDDSKWSEDADVQTRRRVPVEDRQELFRDLPRKQEVDPRPVLEEGYCCDGDQNVRTPSDTKVSRMQSSVQMMLGVSAYRFRSLFPKTGLTRQRPHQLRIECCNKPLLKTA